jgi:hypothetical protein
MTDDGRLFVLLGLAGVAGATAVRGSRGVVRRGRGPSLTPAAEAIRARVTAALERLREDDVYSVRDAFALLSFTGATNEKSYAVPPRPDFAEIPEEIARPAFKIAFPELEDRRQIGNALAVLNDEGIHGQKKAMTLLHQALGQPS